MTLISCACKQGKRYFITVYISHRLIETQSEERSGWQQTWHNSQTAHYHIVPSLPNALPSAVLQTVHTKYVVILRYSNFCVNECCRYFWPITLHSVCASFDYACSDIFIIYHKGIRRDDRKKINHKWNWFKILLIGYSHRHPVPSSCP